MEDDRTWSMLNGADAPVTSSGSTSRRPVMQPLMSKLPSKKEAVNSIKPAVNLWKSLQDERDKHHQAVEREKKALLHVEHLRDELAACCCRGGKLQKADITPDQESPTYDLTRQLSEMSELLSNQAEKIERQQQQLNSQASLINSQAETLIEKNDLITTLEEDQNNLKQVHSLNIKVIEGNLQKMEEELVKQEVKLQERDEELVGNVGRLEDLQEQLGIISDEKESTEKALSDKNYEVHKLKGELILQNELIESFEDRLKDFEESYELPKDEESDVQNRVDDLGSENVPLVMEKNDELEKKTSEIEVLSRTLLWHETKLTPAMNKDGGENVVVEKIADPSLLVEHTAELQLKNKQLRGLEQQIKAKDIELLQRESHFQLIEEKINQFDMKLTYQTQELMDQVEVIAQLESQVVVLEEANTGLHEKVKQQVVAIEERDEKLHLVDMIEEELKEKNSILDVKMKEITGLKDLVDKAKAQDELDTKLQEAEAQVETLRSYSQYQVKQHEDQLMLQYKLEARLQEQMLRLEENRVQAEEQEEELKKLREVSDELDEKKIMLLAKERHLEDLQKEMKEKQEEAEKRCTELSEMLELKTQQLRLNEEEFQRCNLLIMNMSTKIDMMEVKHQLEEEEAMRIQEEELREKTQVLELQTHMLAQLEEFKGTLQIRERQISERDQQLAENKVLLESQLQEKHELILEVAVKKEELKTLEVTMQNQDRHIERLQQQSAEMERDMQLQQQEALRHQQDSYEEREVLEQQLQKQSLLLQEQDLRWHQQQEMLQSASVAKTKTKFWSRKKAKDPEK